MLQSMSLLLTDLFIENESCFNVYDNQAAL